MNSSGGEISIPNERLSPKTKIGFALGDVFGGGSGVVIGMLYLYFLTDIVRVPAALAGVVVLVSKIWDAVIDPALGFLTDRTKTRWGRRRPYFLFGIPLIFLSFVFLWYPLPVESDLARGIFALAGYMFAALISSAIMIPYNSLASELTNDYIERTSLTNIRLIFSGAAALISAVVPSAIIKLFPDQRVGYPMMGVVMGLFYALPYIFTFRWTKERPEFQAEAPALNLKRLFIDPFKLKTFRKILWLFLLGQMTLDLVSAIVVYYCMYYLGRENLTTVIMGILLAVQLLGVPVFSAASARSSKKSAYIAASALRLLASGLIWFVGRDSQVAWLFALAALLGVGNAGSIVMIYSMLADLPDADELFSHERREGMYFGVISFLRQVSTAIVLFLLSLAISATGYRAPVEEVVNGAKVLVKQDQPLAFLTTIRAFFAFVPVLTVGGCIAICATYPLSPAVHKRLSALLEARRAGRPIDPEEEAALKKILG